MSDRLRELRKAFMDAEAQHRDAYRRAVWLEKHLYDATTNEEFETRLSALREQEKLLYNLGALVMTARRKYAAADMSEEIARIEARQRGAVV